MPLELRKGVLAVVESISSSHSDLVLQGMIGCEGQLQAELEILLPAPPSITGDCTQNKLSNY